MHLFKSREPNLVHYLTTVTYQRVPVFSNDHWLRAEKNAHSLAKLALRNPLASGQTHAVWLQDFSAVDIWSHKFIRQKLNYIHMNPVRAGLCDHPAKWRWSSYHAYLPHEPGSVPIDVDWRWLWSADEFAAAADKSAV